MYLGGAGDWGDKGRDCVHTTIVFAVVTNHQHHLPLEDIVVHQPAGNSREVLCRLHVLELSCEEPRGASGGLCHIHCLSCSPGFYKVGGWAGGGVSVCWARVKAIPQLACVDLSGTVVY